MPHCFCILSQSMLSAFMGAFLTGAEVGTALIVQAPGSAPVVAAGVSRLPVVPAEPEAPEMSVAQDLLYGRGRPFPPRRV